MRSNRRELEIVNLSVTCLSDETVKAVGPFYMVSMPGEVKDPIKKMLTQLVWSRLGNNEFVPISARLSQVL